MKKLFKIVSLVMAFALVFALFGCNKPADDKTTTTTGAGTTVAATSAFDAVAKEDIKVGVLHITSIQETSGYTYAHHKGIQEMKESLGLTDAQIIEKDEVPDTETELVKTSLQELVDADCDIIFATSYNYMDSVEEFAAANPKVIFSHCSGSKSNNSNFNNYFGRIYEARYLSGIAAGLKAKEIGTPKIGFVAAMDVKNSEVTGGINAFALGVQSVYPECEVFVKVTGSWYDPVKEGQAAKALIDAGCVVLSQHCDSDTVQTTAQQNNVFGVGYNSDMTTAAPKAHLVAPIWNWGVYYTAAVQQVINGTWISKDYFEGYNVGLVGLSALNESIVAAGTAEKIAEAEAKIKSGELFVFTGPILDNTGKQIIGEGEKLSDGQIQTGINYYIKGVTLS
ncbi:MAG: BMP family ABC transporter substrate-binding protein [Oscillospiraceae bacterium]|nr:BMP family ABC transporter substrate-binding protein [Oscillospiraceae bacterium]